MAGRQEAVDLILNRFSDHWAANATGAPPLAWDGLTFTPPRNLSPWARVTVRHGTSDIATLGGEGNRVWRSPGLVIIQVFTDLGANRKVNDDLVETAIAAFRGVSVGTDPRVRFRRIDAREIGADGPWWQTNVTVDFDYDETV